VLVFGESENAGQPKHTALPFSGAPHAAHRPLLPVYPALQMQALLAINELKNAEQFKHAEIPTKLLYFHSITTNGVHPMLHIHTVDTGLGLNELSL